MAAAVLDWIQKEIGYTNENGHQSLSLQEVENIMKGRERTWASVVDAGPRLRSVLAFRASEIRADQSTTNESIKEKIMLIRKISDLDSSQQAVDGNILELEEEIISARSRQVERKDISDKKRLQLMTLKCYKSKIETNMTIMKELIQRINAARDLHNQTRGEGEVRSDLDTNITIKRLAAFCEAVVLDTETQHEKKEEMHNIFMRPINLKELKDLKISKPKLIHSISTMIRQSQAAISDSNAVHLDVQHSKLDSESRLPTFQDLMFAEHNANISAFQDVELLRKRSAAAQTDVQQRIQELDRLHEQTCPDDGERRLRSLIWQQERDLAAARAAVAAANTAADSLRTAIAAQKEPWAALREEYARLQERLEERNLSQTQFVSLLARNSATKRRLRCKAGLLASSVSVHDGNTACRIIAPSEMLRKALLAECRLLRSPDPTGLLDQLTNSRRPAPGPLSCRAISSDPFLSEVTAALRIPGCLARHCLVAASAGAASRWADTAAQAEWARKHLNLAEADPRLAAWCNPDATLAAQAAVEKLDKVAATFLSRLRLLCHCIVCCAVL
jgi:hypothetical protein